MEQILHKVEDIATCPICGNQVYLKYKIGVTEYYVLECLECNLRMTNPRKDELIYKWNARSK